MSRITDYSFLFQKMFGTPKAMPSSISMSSLSSRSVQAQLRAAGIDTNSAQYKAAIKEMKVAAGGTVGFTTIQSIKNVMKTYDKDGDFIDQTTGLAGLLVTEENAESRKKIIAIPESSRDEMFELMKKEYLRENGVANGDTTKRSDVYTNLYRKVNKNTRLTAGWTLQQYERQYRQAFYNAAKTADSNWEVGKPIPKGALDSITREAVESSLKKMDSHFIAEVDVRV